MKKWILIVVGLVIVLGIVWIVLRSPEDDWIKDSRGVWVKHGQPKETPQEVVEQENLIQSAQKLYQDAKTKNQDLTSGPCLGKIANDWVVDIAHEPRVAADDLPQNQCAQYREGSAHHFIELNPAGELIKIY